MDMILAICKARCEKCHEEDVWLYIPSSKYYGLLCEDYMAEYDIDMEATRKNLGKIVDH